VPPVGTESPALLGRSMVTVVRSLRILSVKDTVWMYGCGKVGVIPEHDANGIAHLHTDERSQHPEMLPFCGTRLQGFK